MEMHCYLHTAFSNYSRTKINYIHCEIFYLIFVFIFVQACALTKSREFRKLRKSLLGLKKVRHSYFLSFHEYGAKNSISYIAIHLFIHRLILSRIIYIQFIFQIQMICNWKKKILDYIWIMWMNHK